MFTDLKGLYTLQEELLENLVIINKFSLTNHRLILIISLVKFFRIIKGIFLYRN